MAADERPDLVRSGDMLSPQEIVETLRIPLVGIALEDEAVLVAVRAFHDIARRL